jgi:hypothetical protein
MADPGPRGVNDEAYPFIGKADLPDRTMTCDISTLLRQALARPAYKRLRGSFFTLAFAWVKSLGIRKSFHKKFSESLSRYSWTISIALVTTSLKATMNVPGSAMEIACLIASTSLGIVS